MPSRIRQFINIDQFLLVALHVASASRTRSVCSVTHYRYPHAEYEGTSASKVAPLKVLQRSRSTCIRF